MILATNPLSMWKKARIQWGMGMVNSQVLVIGGGMVDIFYETILVSNDKVQILRSGQLNVGLITC